MSEKADLDWTMRVVDRVHGFYERLFADLGVSLEEHLLQDGWQMAVTLEAIKPMTATLHWPKAHLLNARARFVGGLLGHTVAHQEAMCDPRLWKYVCDGLNNLADVLSIPREARFDVEENPFLESMPQFRSAMASVMRHASKQSKAVQIQFFEGYTKALRCGTVIHEQLNSHPAMTKSEAAFLLSCDRLAKQGRLYFWTFTFAEVLDLVDTRKKWNHLLTLIRRRWPDACGLRVFEMHKEHGLHVHLLTNKRIDVNQCRQLSKRSGWGRIHVMRIPKEQTPYLAKYLSKERPKAFKRWRLWAGFGKCWDWTKVAQIQVESLHATVARALRDAYSWKGNRDFRERKRIMEIVVANTILHGWQAGFGPGGRKYQECRPEELFQLRQRNKFSASP